MKYRYYINEPVLMELKFRRLKKRRLTEEDVKRLIKIDKTVHKAVKKFGIPQTEGERMIMAEFLHKALHNRQRGK